MRALKYIGIFLLGFSMAWIYPVTDLESGFVMMAFWFGLIFYVNGAIEEDE